MTNPSLHSHTHCQAATTHAQSKAWQRVCLSQRPPNPTDKPTADNEARCPNMRLASCGVKWLNSSAVFQINFSAGLTVSCPEIPHERQAQKRYGQP